MATKRKKRTPRKTYRFQFSLGGIIGIAVVTFCLFMWMFLLGIWAGQTILLPAAPAGTVKKSSKAAMEKKANMTVQTLYPEGKKKNANGQEGR